MEDMLMRKIAEGDEESFNVLYRMWSRRVMYYAYRSLKDIEDAQDVVQETFVQIYRSAPQYRAEGKFPGFLFKIAGNFVRMKFRSSRPIISLDQIEEPEGARTPDALTTDPETSIIEGMDIEKMLDALHPRYREAMILIGSGSSYAEAAQIMGTTEESFAQLLFRARRALRKLMKNERE